MRALPLSTRILLIISVFLTLGVSGREATIDYYRIEVRVIDTMDCILVDAGMKLSGLDNGREEGLRFTLCHGFKGVQFNQLEVYYGGKVINHHIEENHYVVLDEELVEFNSSSREIIFRYRLIKGPDYSAIPYSEFAFKAGPDAFHINAAITRTDNWFPKLDDKADYQALPEFEMTVLTPPGFEVMASGKLVEKNYDREQNKFMFKNYSELVDRSLYFFVNRNIYHETVTPDGFTVRMLIPPDTLSGNVKYLSELIIDAYGFFGKNYGQTGLDEYKLNAFNNTTLGYSGLFNSCNAPSSLFTQKITLNELFYPIRDLVHEISHTWWGNMVKPNALTDYWLYEGFGKFSEPYYLGKVEGKEIELLYRRRMKMVVESDIDLLKSLRFKSYEVESEVIKNESAYHMGALFLFSLRDLMGHDKFSDAIKHYISVNKGRFVDSDILFRSIRKFGPAGVKYYYYGFVDTPGFSEYEVDNLKSICNKTGYRHLVALRNRGRKAFYSKVAIGDGDSYDTITVYLKAGDEKKFTIKSDKVYRPSMVIVDPEGIYPVKPYNVKSPGAKLYKDRNGNIRLMEVLPNSPFHMAGLKDNMILVLYNGTNLAGLTTEEQFGILQRTSGDIIEVYVIDETGSIRPVRVSY